MVKHAHDSNDPTQKSYTEHVHDHDIVGEQKVTAEDAEHLRGLTPEELALEKKLVRKMDFRVMPICIMIYLMNYIDRYRVLRAPL